ncbi:SEC-C metal-binding domain-containing protein, partial [Arcobacteraceae bacterium]|nr:SEC-C metal-binding domain-containing protein [Arcobacteraceae bacterium]
LYLQVLDKAYREHLYSMDTLKTGIGLRGYNQKDPLVEYKKESYNMFIELISSIKYEIIKILFSVQLRDEDEAKREQEALERLKKEMESSVEEISLSTDEVSAPTIEKKVARNSPCPCGSGKKYKQCCGQSGPKKGILAQ